MKNIFIVFLSVVTVIFFWASIVPETHAFRCGSEVVSTGDEAIKLMVRCGSPTSKDYQTKKYRDKWESVETWYYNCGEGDFIYAFTIINSTVVAMDTKGRGAGKSDCQGRR